MVLANEWLRAEIAAKGAELKRLTGNADGYEYMWEANPTYWDKTSPVLFPIVGALKDNTYTYRGKSYHLPRHGFARDLIFEERRLSDTEGIFTLMDSAETRKVYPFAFQLTLHYTLQASVLTCTYEIANPDVTDPLLFSIGGHPAFAARTGKALAYDDYYLSFPDDNELHCHRVEGNLVGDSIRTIPLDNHQLPLSYALFYADALVLKKLNSRQVSLHNTRNNSGIHFKYDDFPYFGIWAAKDADFVCLEPWYGIADTAAHNHLFEKKAGVQRLAAGKIWTRSWSVECF